MIKMLHALDLARDLDSGRLTPAALAEQIAEHIRAVEPNLRSFAHFDENALMVHARRPAHGPLHGLPVAFKDIIDTADQPTRYGSKIYADWQPAADAPIVTMTRRAGGIVLGKSVTTEFAFLEPAATKNPHHSAHTPGGSSSGSAAGVAAGLMPLAFGTQTGGSVIRPASYCGVAAIKTSYRLLPMVGIKTGAWTLDTLGLFGARVRDIAFGLEAISGRVMRIDQQAAGTPVFGVCRMPFAGDAAPDAAAALDYAIAALERRGAKVIDVDMPPELVSAHHAHPTLYNFEGGVSLAWEIDHHRSDLSDVLLRHFAPSEPISLEQYDAARRVAKRARQRAKDWFAPFDALLTYSAPGTAPDRSSTGEALYNRLFTLLGTPCVNVPSLLGNNGLPVGVQVVTAFGSDQRALQAADYLEHAISHHTG